MNFEMVRWIQMVLTIFNYQKINLEMFSLSVITRSLNQNVTYNPNVIRLCCLSATTSKDFKSKSCYLTESTDSTFHDLVIIKCNKMKILRLIIKYDLDIT